jgi:hypothetical protein
MIAYKVLETGGRGRFSGFRWPLPNGGPGDWVEAEVDPCRTGVHAVHARHLPYWLGATVYEIELDGPVRDIGHKLVAARGRLLRHIDAWDDEAKRDFSLACIERTRELAAAAPDRLSRWVDPNPETGPTLLGYIAERVAEEAGGRDAGVAERARQAEWLVARLGLRSA